MTLQPLFEVPDGQVLQQDILCDDLGDQVLSFFVETMSNVMLQNSSLIAPEKLRLSFPNSAFDGVTGQEGYFRAFLVCYGLTP